MSWTSMFYDGRSISRNVTSSNILVPDMKNLLYYKTVYPRRLFPNLPDKIDFRNSDDVSLKTWKI